MKHYSIIAEMMIKGEPDILLHAVNIENETLPSGKIITKKISDGIHITIIGNFKIGRMKYTIDDILHSLFVSYEVMNAVLVDQP